MIVRARRLLGPPSSSSASFLYACALAIGCGGDTKHAADAADTHVADTAADTTPETTADTAPDTAPDTTDTAPDTTADATDADTTTPAGRLHIIDLYPPVDLTSDGDLALLEDFASADGDVYFYSTLAGRADKKTTVGSPEHDFVTALADGGRVSALHAVPVAAGLWTSEGGWLDVPSPYPAGCDQDVGGAWDISADGHVAVGSFWDGCTTRAFRWTDASGTGLLTPLQVLGQAQPGGALAPVNRATVVSDDGQVAAGFAENQTVDRSPAIWNADGSGFLLQPDAPDAPGEVLAISHDGSVVAGTLGNMGFYWTQAGGIAYTGVPPEGLPSDQTFVNAIARDGALLFGASGDPFFGVPAAFVWTQAAGARQLQGIVAAAGIAIPDGLVLTNVLAASRDGSILLGSASDAAGTQKSFVLELPVGAYGIE